MTDNMINTKYIFPLLLFICFLTNSTVGWWDWGYIYDDRRWYYVMQAISWFPLAFSLEYYDKSDNLHRLSKNILICLLINNLADELFFDPINLGWNEVMFGLFLILQILIGYRIKHTSNG